MLMTVAPASALRQTQRGNNYNPRDQPEPDSATEPSYASSFSMNGIVNAAPPPGTLYVRALYDYEADDRTSLSFHEGDVIQVITQLESGWWDGVINGVRGWFPSNYCQIIAGPEDGSEVLPQNGDVILGQEDDFEDQVRYEEEEYDDENESDQDDLNGLPLEGTNSGPKSSGGADFWIPQATRDGRLFYYNTMTGESSMELPLESPTTLNEMGPRDRMNVNMPEKTRPPPELMARGLTQDEDEDSEAASASEVEGESIMMGGARMVSFLCFAYLPTYLPRSPPPRAHDDDHPFLSCAHPHMHMHDQTMCF
jgi:son of sevenless